MSNSGNVVLNLTREEADALSAELRAVVDGGGWSDMDDADPEEIRQKIRRQL